MISSFTCTDTQELYETGENRKFASIARVALRKLDMLAACGRRSKSLFPKLFPNVPPQSFDGGNCGGSWCDGEIP